MRYEEWHSGKPSNPCCSAEKTTLNDDDDDIVHMCISSLSSLYFYTNEDAEISD